MKKNILKAGLLWALFLLFTVSCGGGGGGGASATSGQPGQLTMSLTDASGCDFEHVFVTIRKVRVHKSSSAEDGDGGWIDITPSNAPLKVDLLSLQNGLTEGLGIAPLASGHYTQIRLYLEKNTGNQLNNYVVLAGGGTFPLKVPSGFQTGIKIVHDFDIEPGQPEEIVLDFDACRSIREMKNGKFFILKPVIQAFVKKISGGIAGAVDALSSGAVVKAEVNGHVVKQTRIKPDGTFVLSPLPNSDEVKIEFPSDPTGTFDVVIVSDTTATVVTTGVPVTTGTQTVISTTANPTHLPLSAIGVLNGKIDPTSADARVSQTINGKPYQISRHSPDLADGSFEFILPADAPLFGAFTTPLPVSYTADPSATAKYTVDTPNDDGLYQVKSQAVTISSTPTTVNFTGADKLVPMAGAAGTVSGNTTVTGLPAGFSSTIVVLSAQMNNENVNSIGVPVSTVGAFSYAIDDLAPGTYTLTVAAADGLHQISPDITVTIPSTGGIFTGKDFTLSP